MPAVKDPQTGRFVSPNNLLTATEEPEAKPDESKEAQKKPEANGALVDFGNDFIEGTSRVLKRKPKKEDEEKTDEKTPEKAKEEKPADKPKEKPKAASVAPKKETSPARTEPDYDKIAEAAGRGVAKVLGKTDEKKDGPPENPDADLPEPEQRKLKVLRYMEKSNAKYKGVADKYKSNLKKLSEYASKWEAEHPGQTFDDEAEEHADFYDKNDLFQPWDDEDYSDAKAEIIADRKVAESTAEMNKKLGTLEREKKALEARPLVDQQQTVAARDYWKQIGGEFDGLILETGQLDTAKVKSLQEKDPDTFAYTVESAKRLDALVEAAYLLKKGLIDYNKDNPAHAHLAGFALAKERELMSRPPEKRTDSAGRPFKPANEYYALTDSERNNCWTYNENDLAALLAAEEAVKMKAFITAEEEKFNRKALLRGLATKDSLLQEKADKSKEIIAKAKALQASEEQEQEEEAEVSPSSIASPKSATAMEEGKKTAVSGQAAWLEKMF